jgi:hypothetical protein
VTGEEAAKRFHYRDMIANNHTRSTVSLIGNSAIYQVITSDRYQVGVAERRAFDNHQRIGYEITSSDCEFVSQPRDG